MVKTQRIAWVLIAAMAACGGSTSSQTNSKSAPTADAGPDQAVASGAPVSLDGSASADPAGVPVAFQWTQTLGPSVSLSSATASKPGFTAPAIPSGQAPVVLTFSLVVSDANGTSAPSAVNVTVNPARPATQTPVANAGVDQAVASGATVTLDGSASVDPSGAPVTFAWTQIAGPAVTLSGANTARPTFASPAVAGSAPETLSFSLVVASAQGSATATVTITVNPPGANFPAPPGTPPPADPNPAPLLAGGNGSHRFEVGAPNGLYLQDPTPGEPTVRGFVVVTLGSPASGQGFLPPADTVVTMNGVPLLRDPTLNGTFFRLDAAGPQPRIGTGGQMVIVATGTDPQSGKQIQRQLVMDCPTDIEVTSTPAIGSSLTGVASIHITSPSSVTINPPGTPIVASTFPQVTLIGYDRATRTLSPSGGPRNIGPGSLDATVPVTATSADAYLLDLRWP